MPTLLFLCTGNYYRSRFVEHLFNAHAHRLGLPWVAESRGLAIERGINNVGPIAAVTLRALEARGVAVASPIRMPLQARDEEFAAAQRVIALYEREHRPLVEQRFPAWAERVEYLAVPDVGELGADAALSLMEQATLLLLDELQRSG
jgi:protein-tyrosine phosphatase